MARSFYLGLLLAATWPLIVAADPWWNIKSKTSSGNGCPSPTWINVDYTFRRDSLHLGYPDFRPEVSPAQPLQHSTSVCQLILELDQLPGGYQFAVSGITHFAQVYFEEWTWWRQWFATRVGFGEDGPYSRMDINPNLGVKAPTNGGVNLKSGAGVVDVLAWSPCFRPNGTVRMYINERVVLGRMNGSPAVAASARLEPGDPQYSYSTAMELVWRTC